MLGLMEGLRRGKVALAVRLLIRLEELKKLLDEISEF